MIIHSFCRPFQGSIEPKAVYKQFTLKPVPASNRAQLQRRHQSCLMKRVQSKIDSRVKRKDSHSIAAAPEPGDVNYTLDAKGQTYNISIHAEKDTNSAKVAQEYAVRFWLYHSPIT